MREDGIVAALTLSMILALSVILAWVLGALAS